jgi:IS30 family transposase
MGKRYEHLKMEEREVIGQMHYAGSRVSEIARAIGRDKGTVSRELKRNSSAQYNRYTLCQAHRRAVERRAEAGNRYRLKNAAIRQYVHDGLAIGWSPELIAGRLSQDHPDLSISHEAIYQYVYHPETEGRDMLIAFLCRGHRRRKKKGIGRKERRTKIPNRVSIEQRPVEAEKRCEIGHWEGDSLVSRKSLAALNSLTERKSRLLLLTKIDRKTAQQTTEAVLKRFAAIPETMRKTLTMDNGTENAGHEDITAHTGMNCYFARPYASWQRGTNEHINGLVRRYLPKRTDFSKITDVQIASIEWLINNRPMKCLGFKTPIEVASVAVALGG